MMNELTLSTLPFERPTLLLDKGRVIRNIEKMADKASRSRVRLRPHFKTHQSAEIGEWFRERGVESITVSSVDMAAYFADAGWSDILIAFPVNIRQIGRINELAGRVNLHVLVESAETTERLQRLLKYRVRTWLKIDSGYQRTGIAWDDLSTIRRVAERVAAAPTLFYQGILTHAGQTYRARSREGVGRIYNETLDRMQQVRAGLQDSGLPTAISIGDTPGCSVAESFSGVDEIRPGNFVFYDLMQLQIGCCEEEEIAVAVACPVVSKHESRKQLVLYGGAIHLSKEFLRTPEGQASYGGVAHLSHSEWGPLVKDCYIASLSQEHGVLQATEELFRAVEVGDVLAVIPVHSCLTANLMGSYRMLDGQVLEMARMP